MREKLVALLGKNAPISPISAALADLLVIPVDRPLQLLDLLLSGVASIPQQFRLADIRSTSLSISFRLRRHFIYLRDRARLPPPQVLVRAKSLSRVQDYRAD